MSYRDLLELFKKQNFAINCQYEGVDGLHFAEEKLEEHCKWILGFGRQGAIDKHQELTIYIRTLAFAINGFFIKPSPKAAYFDARVVNLAKALFDFEHCDKQRALSSFRKVMQNQATLSDFELMLDQASDHLERIYPTPEERIKAQSLQTELSSLSNNVLHGTVRQKL